MVGYYTQRSSMSIIPSLVGIILTIVLYQYLTDAAMNGMFYLVLFEPNERKIRFFVFIPYSLKVLVLQFCAANKLQARCRPSGDHSIQICGPVLRSQPRSVQLTNSANSTSDNERSRNTRANKNGHNHSNAQFPAVVV